MENIVYPGLVSEINADGLIGTAANIILSDDSDTPVITSLAKSSRGMRVVHKISTTFIEIDKVLRAADSIGIGVQAIATGYTMGGCDFCPFTR